VTRDANFIQVPAGERLPGTEWFANYENPALSGRSAYAFGSWATLFAGHAIPSTIDYHVTVQSGTLAVDRAPDAGEATSSRLDVTRASALTAYAVAPVTYAPNGAWPLLTGRLQYDSVNGPTLPNRFATVFRDGVRVPEQERGGVDFDEGDVCIQCGGFVSSAPVTRTTTFALRFEGDGFTDPSAPVLVRAVVKAFVSLNRPANATVARNTDVRFSGVVRPAQPGSNVLIQARSGGAGSAWRDWRTVPLQGSGDTFYSMTWRPATAGTTTFRVLWLHGSGADGAVANGISNYATVTVT
jgi:hypothetical protein